VILKDHRGMFTCIFGFTGFYLRSKQTQKSQNKPKQTEKNQNKPSWFIVSWSFLKVLKDVRNDPNMNIHLLYVIAENIANKLIFFKIKYILC
jgi:hypothetical protein